ncbi:AraC family transcriptional regulator [Marinobacter sp. 71-i]|uniref:AraC family transcriptional regulator n=1 Tax=Marinobacter iranensis TaxID=2962607 RepID=A0ABT5YG83_9GAMM|nr:AraC family transcriptional regulator [Marinobacter iranensis]MDF0752684.1 AraC family transcriptional regulator [Marinobacter iranensis]
MKNELIDAARHYAEEHANADGVAITPVPGLRVMCVDAPRGKLESTYRPLVCLVLQGAKYLLVGSQAQTCIEGQSVIVAADMPVSGQVLRATSIRPYIALAVELDMNLLAELADSTGSSAPPAKPSARTLFLQDSSKAILDCGYRLMQLIDTPAAIPILRPGLMKELHFWLLAGPAGAQLRTMVASGSTANSLARAIAILRADFRSRIPIERLAEAAYMGVTTFHKRFKELTSLTPGQYQKRLRLIEARRLMLYDGTAASRAAYEVGYESVSQFTRDYARMFGIPPKRHTKNHDQRRGFPSSCTSEL